MISIIHTASGFLSLFLGATILLSAKGTARHRFLGWCYCATMAILNLSALAIYSVSGTISFFHIFVVVSVVTMLGGLVPVLLRRRIKGWLVYHYHFMCWSYVGLLSAASAEAYAHVPPLRELVVTNGYWLLWVSITVISIIGWVVIRYWESRLVPQPVPTRRTPSNPEPVPCRD